MSRHSHRWQLSERLEQLKSSDIAFSEVDFSPAVRKLQKAPMPVC